MVKCTKVMLLYVTAVIFFVMFHKNDFSIALHVNVCNTKILSLKRVESKTQHKKYWNIFNGFIVEDHLVPHFTCFTTFVAHTSLSYCVFTAQLFSVYKLVANL